MELIEWIYVKNLLTRHGFTGVYMFRRTYELLKIMHQILHWKIYQLHFNIGQYILFS